MLRSFNGKGADSSDDNDTDEFDEIHDHMKKEFVDLKDIDILKWWQDHSILYKQLSHSTMGL
jgi:hypothetical protein